MEPEDAASTGESSWFRALRRVLVAVLVVAMATLIVGSRYHAPWHVCDTELARTGQAVRICHPYAIADLLPILLLIALLLIPEVDELALPGIGMLKKRVARQEREAERMGASITALQQQISAQANANVTVILQEAERRIAEKRSRYEAEIVEEPVGGVTGLDTPAIESLAPADPWPQAAIASTQLLQVWARVQPWTQLARSLRESDALGTWLSTPAPDRDISHLRPADRRVVDGLPTDLVLTLSQQHALLRWNDVFNEEIESVRLVRNEVAHSPRILDRDDLDRAIDLAEQLIDLLHEGLGSAAPG